MHSASDSKTEAKKKLLTEWAVLDRMFREMKAGVVRDAIEARREQLRAQISALMIDATEAAAQEEAA